MSVSTLMKIEAMLPSHLDACAAIVEGSGFFRKHGLTGAVARRELSGALLQQRADLRVALADGQVGGFAWFVRRGAFDRSGYIRLIVVDEMSRGRGKGRALMKALEDDYLGQMDIILLVTQSNGAARKFYERIGYVQCGALPGYVRATSTELIYRKAMIRGGHA